ncbi:acyltransferase family protein [Paenibacillus turpanensis]|uniref:acyltransferase family protein n=1 Tax=Paenibacillus turpanensis TaxID=2689078 RepID=UPI00140C1E61
MEKTREIWIDFAKGLSIILVVMGHSGDGLVDHYLGWFRIPFFFIVSGFLFKAISRETFPSWSKKRVQQLIVPYIAYGISTALIIFIVNGADIMGFGKNLMKLAYGGQVLKGEFGVYWFITCLLITQVLFGFLSRFSLKTEVTIIAFLYVISHSFNWTQYLIPWNVDSVFLTIIYYAIGYHSKELLISLIKKPMIVIASFLLSALFVALDYSKALPFTLDIKYNIHSYPVLDIIIPLSLVFAILVCCYYISKVVPFRFNPIARLGTMTITIMYLHILTNIAIKKIFNVEYGFITYTVLGVTIPLLAHLIIKNIPLASKYFIGTNNKPVVSRAS